MARVPDPQTGFDVAFMSGFCTAAARLGAPDTGLISFHEMVDQVGGLFYFCFGLLGVLKWAAVCGVGPATTEKRRHSVAKRAAPDADPRPRPKRHAASPAPAPRRLHPNRHHLLAICSTRPQPQGRSIHEATRAIPIIGDGDTGYGNAMNVKRTVRGYAAAGFAGGAALCFLWWGRASPARPHRSAPRACGVRLHD